MLITKAKIRWVMAKSADALKSLEGGAEILELYGKNKHAILPNMPKFVRLTFHDCILEEDGTGCNGCLNFEKMGAMFSEKPCASRRSNCSLTAGGIHPEKGPFMTDNNNLLWTAKVLEEVYKNPAFGPQIMKSNQSLFQTGKSRADLWAFAGLVALQRSIENNNEECDPSKPPPCLNQANENSPSCFIKMPVLQFRSGRSDCTSSCSGENDHPFCTEAAEVHPNPHGNGSDTTKFFADNFKLTNRETVALMGVHTLGHPEEVNSMFRHYGWTPQGRTEFNNQYFINLANKTNYQAVNPKRLLSKEQSRQMDQCNLTASAFIGDEYGNPFPVGYRVRSERRTNAFGPWNWSLMGSSCSSSICSNITASGASFSINSCCNWMDFCQNNQMGCPFRKNCGRPGEPECEPFSNFQRTSMLSVDMGLHIKFETNEDGRPVGCPGMDTRWLENKRSTSKIVECDINDDQGDDSHTMAELVQLFASQQDLWVAEFRNVFLKMLENGVNQADLVDASNSWMDAVCDDRRGACFPRDILTNILQTLDTLDLRMFEKYM